VFGGPLANVDILVDAQDEGHGVKEVRLAVNGSVVATDAHAPYLFANAGFPDGGWVLVAIAEDWAGNITESEPVAIGVGQDPPEPEPEPETGESGDELGDVGTDDGLDGPGIDGTTATCTCSTRQGERGGGALALGLLVLVAVRRRRY
jgi:MYXO-CTERM domain-containing protein